jgi:dethiobiotin synthase
VAAALLHRYRGGGATYWKPVQTGIETDDDTAEVRRLSDCGAARVLDAGLRLPRPVSPHLAARLAGISIDVPDLARRLAGAAHAGPWIVEGAGGLLVPLAERALVVDLIGLLGLPVVIVARSGLGTINHTLLSLEALEKRALRAAGVVMVGVPDDENRRAIEHYGRTVVLGEMPRFSALEPRVLQAWADTALDVDGRLGGWLA